MSDNQPFVVSSVNEEQEQLQARFQELGYLFFKRYVPDATCNDLLASLLAQTGQQVALDPASGLPTLRGRPFVEADTDWDIIYPRIQALEEFHGFFHTRPMLDLMRLVSGTEVFVYPMKMARISTPGKIGYETPPHQDAYSHHAGPTMAGIWVALHDISAPMGRVKVLPGSHKGGVRKVFKAAGVGGVQCEIYPDETCWHVADSARGDVLIFHSATVHKAEPNTTDSTVRMSVDTRFCDYGAPVFSTNLEPHHGWRIDGLDWQRVYRDWRHKDYQYYWKEYPNLF
ncbi:MAG: phytanoyl-CoA dioxygenase family protein [Halioglobus sp.]|nr:phytanoyl-CoA dioxygenase family protein [Halioglobus sp.]